MLGMLFYGESPDGKEKGIFFSLHEARDAYRSGWSFSRVISEQLHAFDVAQDRIERQSEDHP